MSSENKPVIFLAYSNDRVDRGRYLRNLVSETRSIRQVLEDRGSTNYRVIVRGNAILDDILNVFDQNPSSVQVFHFSGHADEWRLMLENARGEGMPANAEAFNRLLINQPSLKLVFLNGCSTWAQAEVLAQLGLGAVIATSSAINDRAAAIFASRFYERLAEGVSVAKAFEAAEIKAEISLGSMRSIFWDEIEIKDESPWRLFGNETNWRLKIPQLPNQASNLLHLMCNREAQVEAFVDSLEQLLIDTSHQPHFYMIHGSRDDKHKSLVTRLKEVEIRHNAERLFGKETGRVDFFNVINWPVTGELEMRKRNLKRNIARVRNFPGISTKESEWKAEKFIELQRDRGGAVVFQHTISGDQWDTITYQLIDWYINEFWNVTVEKEMPQLIIFLNIVYPEQKGSLVGRFLGLVTTRKDIQRELESIAKKSQKRCKLLTELNLISYSDVTGWVDKHYPDELPELPMTLFKGEKGKKLSMETVEAKLKQEVQRLERTKWLFNE